jgi:hypothetical protein
MIVIKFLYNMVLITSQKFILNHQLLLGKMNDRISVQIGLLSTDDGQGPF